MCWSPSSPASRRPPPPRAPRRLPYRSPGFEFPLPALAVAIRKGWGWLMLNWGMGGLDLERVGGEITAPPGGLCAVSRPRRRRERPGAHLDPVDVLVRGCRQIRAEVERWRDRGPGAGDALPCGRGEQTAGPSRWQKTALHCTSLDDSSPLLCDRRWRCPLCALCCVHGAKYDTLAGGRQRPLTSRPRLDLGGGRKRGRPARQRYK